MTWTRRTATGIGTAVLVVAGVAVGHRVHRLARIAAGAVAKQTCSCVFVDGGDEAGCRADQPPVLDRVHVTVDRAERHVRAWVPVLADRTARHRDGSGCTLAN